MIRQSDMNYLRERDAVLLQRVEQLERALAAIHDRQVHNEDRLTVLEKGRIKP